MNYVSLSGVIGFEWDEGNQIKNLVKHQIDIHQSEEVFLDEQIIVIPDHPPFKYSEPRHTAIGKNNQHHILFIVFTFRSNNIRIISARPASRKERQIYEHQNS